jgi:transposase-like protein
MAEDTAEGLRDAIRVDQQQVRGQLEQMVRSSVEETLNALLQAEADQICGAGRYERSPERVDTRAGHYERKLETKAGEVRLKVPKLRSLPFETAIIERYRRRESSVEEALVEMYLAGGERATGGRHYRGVVGHAGELGHGVAPEPEDLPPHRSLAQPHH